MFGIGGFELFIILLFGFLIFGPDKLPEIARTVGTAIAKFKKAQEEMSAVLKSEVLEASEEPKKQSKEGSSEEEASSPESFAERKARYDKERAERKRREAMEENRAAMKKESAEHARKLEEKEASSSAADSVTADQLYGNVPMKPKKQSEKKPVEEKAAKAEVEPESNEAAAKTEQKKGE